MGGAEGLLIVLCFQAFTEVIIAWIVQKLQERGVFKLKGGISFVAKRLSCSAATVYRYLGELEN